jgi:phosphoribosylaminoimidazolecarboxamide formyltransferase/IMP cyclohydrolase
MRAILSVSDKTGIEAFAKGLVELDFEIYSTGGTQQALAAAGLPVQPVTSLTGFPEILGGRVKTLHPAIHAGILARRHLPADRDELAGHGLSPIDLVAVNLYPFEATVARLAAMPSLSETDALAMATEQIDIGGPTMLRAAAKNSTAVLPLCDPADYPEALEALRQPGGPGRDFRRWLAAKAFRHTAVYDAFIAAYLGASDDPWPEEMALGLHKVQELRYGENPQQRAAFYALHLPGGPGGGLANAQIFQGKPLSYNNILDADAAWAVVSDFALQPGATVAIIKHTNPCGLACAADSLTAYDLALAGDPLAAFGGIVALNAVVDEGLARRLVERFYEIVLAPEFSAGALSVLAARPSLRVLALPPSPTSGLRWQSVQGGMLIQDADRLEDAEVDLGQVVTRRAPSEEERATLRFAWRAVRHVHSNAIVVARAGDAPGSQALVGMGAGQPSRVAAVEIAVQRAGAQAPGSVLASDAFFPKADGVEVSARAGVRAIVQPGGSQGDAEVIAAADAAGMAMVFTGSRHFLH